MTQAVVYVTRRDRITGYSVVGHAQSENTGGDVICAAVSALAQSTVNSLAGVAGVTPHVLRKPGMLVVRISKTSGMRWHDAQIILRSCALGLTRLADQFPAFVRVRCKLDEPAASGINKRRKEARYGGLHNRH